MALGFVLIKTSPGSERKVFQRLLEVSAIEELFPLFGEFDLIAKIEAQDFDALGQAVVGQIRSVPGVIRTQTLTVTAF